MQIVPYHIESTHNTLFFTDSSDIRTFESSVKENGAQTSSNLPGAKTCSNLPSVKEDIEEKYNKQVYASVIEKYEIHTPTG